MEYTQFKNNQPKGGELKMAEKVTKVGVKREKGYLYYIDKQGDVSCAKMKRGGKKKKKR